MAKGSWSCKRIKFERERSGFRIYFWANFLEANAILAASRELKLLCAAPLLLWWWWWCFFISTLLCTKRSCSISIMELTSIRPSLMARFTSSTPTSSYNADTSNVNKVFSSFLSLELYIIRTNNKEKPGRASNDRTTRIDPITTNTFIFN